MINDVWSLIDDSKLYWNRGEGQGFLIKTGFEGVE